MRSFAAASLFDGASLIDDGAVLVDDDGVVRDVGTHADVSSRSPATPQRVSGLLMPGLVDAYCALDDAFLRGKTALGAGIDRWLDSARGARDAADESEVDDARQAAIASLAACGVAAVGDVGVSARRSLAEVGVARVSLQTVPLSTPDATRRALAIARREGLAALVCDASPAGAPIDVLSLDDLARAGALDDATIVAHLGAMSTEVLSTLAASTARVVVCPRAALAIDVRLPPIGAMVAGGLFPALGTGSAGASGGHDVLAEAKAVAERYPSVSAAVIFAMATSAGADALSLPRHGRLTVGARPGLLLIEGAPPRGVVDPARFWLTRPPSARRWLVPPRAEAPTTTAREA